MKILIAVDSYKGSLTSLEAGQAIQAGIQNVSDIHNIEIIPIADGGEGILSVMLHTLGGKVQTIPVHNPCMELIEAEYGISTDGGTAFIEMANASGLPLITNSKRDPMETTTYGTGELIRDALKKGCRKFIIGIGGSATNDAGTGMLQALGYRFLDKDGNPLGQGGKILENIVHICTQNVHKE